MRITITLDDPSEYTYACALREEILSSDAFCEPPKPYDIDVDGPLVAIEDTPVLLQHRYLPDGRGPQYDEDICVRVGSAGWCGRPRAEHRP